MFQLHRKKYFLRKKTHSPKNLEFLSKNPIFFAVKKFERVNEYPKNMKTAVDSRSKLAACGLRKACNYSADTKSARIGQFHEKEKSPPTEFFFDGKN